MGVHLAVNEVIGSVVMSNCSKSYARRRKCRGYTNGANTTFQHRCTIRNADTDRNASDVEQCG